MKKNEKREKIVVNKDFLKEFKSLLIGLENCDVYEINVTDVLDVYCEATLISERRNEYRTYDGFIKIAAAAKDTAESYVLKNRQIGTEWDHRFKERLEMCGACADMTSFSLKDKRRREMHIYVPYNPLEGVLHGSEIELSNCPSWETDGEGNILIFFGKSSKQPKRKDNNYDELIEGWKEAFGDYLPKVLNVKVENLSSFSGEQIDFLFYFNILDKNCKKSLAALLFMDCKNIEIDMFFPKNGDCDIVTSKMADGRIYVGLDGLGMEFTCASVIEYEYCCNRTEEN